MPLDKLHEALGAALGGEEAPEAAPEAPAATDAPTPQEAAQTAEPGAAEDAAAAPEGQTPAERTRGPDGKFARAQPPGKDAPKATPPGTATQKGPPSAAQPPGAQAPTPAPRTMAPAAREHWNALPREVKDAFLKVEGLASRANTELQQAKQGYQRFQEALQPFLPHLQAKGIEPASAVRELFQMEYTLRSGSPAERTGLIAHLMSLGGVTPDALASALEGRPPPQEQRQASQDPRVDELLGQMRQVGERRQADATGHAAEQLRVFESTNPEFLQDVALDMADLVAIERRKGRPVDLQRLYEKACQLNDDVRTVLETRRAQETQRAQQQKAAQARYVGGSIQSEPAPPTSGKRPGIAGLYDALQQNLGG